MKLGDVVRRPHFARLQHQHESADPDQQEERDSHQRVFHLNTPLSGYDGGDPRPAQREQNGNKMRFLTCGIVVSGSF
ncbi:hypothetical protein C7M51_02232 [Mixta intestinalis]|jgi:hypothetical protein|uniref:Uncharacterized protein n=1 Tax=Mixta intestinalis TaxID=1615494 RepID=A0A6P1Q1F1_9GAMM|nr:hypothetical protein C7M51_02232 [Mixta intestinalis]